MSRHGSSLLYGDEMNINTTYLGGRRRHTKKSTRKLHHNSPLALINKEAKRLMQEDESLTRQQAIKEASALYRKGHLHHSRMSSKHSMKSGGRRHKRHSSRKQGGKRIRRAVSRSSRYM